MYRTQIYKSNSGTGKTQNFIPFQIEQNKFLGCSNFKIIGIEKPKSINDFKFLDVKKYLIQKDSTALKNEIFEFLKGSDNETNIIIDEFLFIDNNINNLEKEIYSNFKFRLLTLVGQ